MLPYNKSNIILAKNLRNNMTEQERKLWYVFLRNCDVRFQRQKAIGNYITDFFCASCKIAIEIDGGQHYEDANIKYDAKRSEYFNSLGIKVLRYTNRELDCSFNDVCNDILRNINSTPQSRQSRDSSPARGAKK